MPGFIIDTGARLQRNELTKHRGVPSILPAYSTISNTFRQPSTAIRDMISLQRFDFALWVHLMPRMSGLVSYLA